MTQLNVVVETLRSAIKHHQAGELTEAETLYKQILADHPNQPDALHLLGVLLSSQKQYDSAIDLLRRSLAAHDENPAAHYNLGATLQAAGRTDEAIQYLRRALALDPSYLEALVNLGNALLTKGQLNEAVACYRRALAIRPDCVEAHNSYGMALRMAGQFDQAIAELRQAVVIKPDYADAHTNLGAVLLQTNRNEEALIAFQRAIELNPETPEAQYNLATALMRAHRYDEAVPQFKEALVRKPNYPVAYSNLGHTLRCLGRADEAVAALRQSLSLKPDDPVTHSKLLFALHFHPDYDPQALLREHRAWNEAHARRLSQPPVPFNNDRSPERRLRVGYVSPDFWRHVLGNHTIPLLSTHDHENFEIFCYASVAYPDDVTQQLQGYADIWRDVRPMTDDRLAQQIRQDGIDILVDLTLHAADGRPLLFARKPAPVQITWMGYPGTTGMSALNYRLSDPFLDPPEQHDENYAEKTLRLPHSFWCYLPLNGAISVNSLPATDNGHITFGSLNNPAKVNPKVLELWARVLHSVANSRLLLLAPAGKEREKWLEGLQNHGIAPDRIAFINRLGRPEYLAVYHRIDIVLDTFPYNGHTTALDALWMGVPIISLAGATAVSRGGLSLLSNVGLADLVAATPDQYVELATQLAADLPRLTTLRSTLRGRLQDSPLMNAHASTRAVEQIYRETWRHWTNNPHG